MKVFVVAPAILVVLVGLASIACTPDPSTSASAAAGEPTTTVVATVDPATEASQLLAKSFSSSGEASRVKTVVFEEGMLRVTLDLPIATVGDSDVYQRICLRLSSLISTPEDPGEVLGVQTFGPGGPVVATGARQLRCAKFHL